MSDNSTDSSDNDSSNDSSGDRKEFSKSKSRNTEALSGSKQRSNSKEQQAETTGWSPEDGAGYVPTEEGGSNQKDSSSGDSGSGSSDE